MVGLGLGLMITATINVTVGNAAVELAGPVAGVQTTAIRFGAALGVAVLGGVMAATTAASFASKLDNSALARAIAAPLKKVGSTAVAAGVAPLSPLMPSPVADLIRSFTATAFVQGVTTTSLVISLCVRSRRVRKDDAFTGGAEGEIGVRVLAYDPARHLGAAATGSISTAVACHKSACAAQLADSAPVPRPWYGSDATRRPPRLFSGLLSAWGRRLSTLVADGPGPCLSAIK